MGRVTSQLGSGSRAKDTHEDTAAVTAGYNWTVISRGSWGHLDNDNWQCLDSHSWRPGASLCSWGSWEQRTPRPATIPTRGQSLVATWAHGHPEVSLHLEVSQETHRAVRWAEVAEPGLAASGGVGGAGRGCGGRDGPLGFVLSCSLRTHPNPLTLNNKHDVNPSQG